MRKNFICTLILFTFSIVSCAVEEGKEREGINQTRAYTSITVESTGSDIHDKIYHIRFFIFDNATFKPQIEVNEKVVMDSHNQNASKFTATFEIKQGEDKMIVAVVNEPSSLSRQLDAVQHPDDIENQIFSMDSYFDDDHTELLANTGLPMSGAVRHITVDGTNNIETKAKNVELSLERSVARVELWLEKDTELSNAKLSGSTKVSLSKSYGEGYLATGTLKNKTRYQTGEYAGDNFGHLLSALDPSVRKEWSYNGNEKEITTTKELICSFYTPERTADAANNTDKLILNLDGISTSVGSKGTEIILDKLINPATGNKEDINTIKRNNVYRITGTLTEGKIKYGCNVETWENAENEIKIDGQYYLKVSDDKLRLANDGDAVTITAETNYNRSDLGFSEGIIYKDSWIKYYDKGGNEIPINDGNGKREWLEVSLENIDNTLKRSITFTSKNALTSFNKGCYAIVTIHAGNMVKQIKITRTPKIALLR